MKDFSKRQFGGNDTGRELDWKRVGIAVTLTVLAVVAVGAYLVISTQPGIADRAEIAVVDIEGSIENFRTSHRLVEIGEREDVKAIVIRVNSPGGYVSPCFQLEGAISNLSERKPVIVSTEQINASGAYLATSAADSIYVHSESQVGGLGAIAVWQSYENFFKKEGIEHHVFKTAEHKDMFAPWRGPTEEEEEMIQNELWEVVNRMVETIERNRPDLENRIPLRVIEGEAVTGFQAVELDLADGIIHRHRDAVDKAAEAAGLEPGEYDLISVD